MILYSELPAGRTRQVASDLLMLVWTVVWIRIGAALDNTVMRLAAPGREIADAGTSLENNLRSAGDKVSNIPLVGDDVRTPFDRAGGAGSALRSAGEAQVNAVDLLATFLGVTIAVIPIILLLALWLPRRVGFVRRASAARTLIGSDTGLDLLALRALTRRPVAELVGAHADPAGAWRDRDPEAVRTLAELELAATGLRLPRVT